MKTDLAEHFKNFFRNFWAQTNQKGVLYQHQHDLFLVSAKFDWFAQTFQQYLKSNKVAVNDNIKRFLNKHILDKTPYVLYNTKVERAKKFTNYNLKGIIIDDWYLEGTVQKLETRLKAVNRIRNYNNIEFVNGKYIYARMTMDKLIISGDNVIKLSRHAIKQFCNRLEKEKQWFPVPDKNDPNYKKKCAHILYLLLESSVKTERANASKQLLKYGGNDTCYRANENWIFVITRKKNILKTCYAINNEKIQQLYRFH